MYTLLLAFLAGCGSDSVGNDDVGNNSTMTDSIIRNDSISADGKTVYVSIESLPGWLKSWISDAEETSGVNGVIFRDHWSSPALYRGEWKGELVYRIEELGSSALFGLLFNEDGYTVHFKNSQAFVDFCNYFVKVQKRVYIKNV
jgi:hypothetical protein